MVDPCLLNVTGEHLCFGEPGCRLPISVEDIGGIVDLVAFKDVQVQRRKAVDHIAPEVLRAKDAEVGSHVPQMFVTLADNSLLSFGFALYDLVDIRFPVILKAGSRTENLPRDLRLLYGRHRGSAFGSPDFTTSQHLQRNIHSGLDDGKAAVGVQHQRGVWRRLDTHTGEWGIGRAERSAIDFSAKYTFLSAKEIPANALTCAFCSESAILTIEFCGRGKDSVLPNFF